MLNTAAKLNTKPLSARALKAQAQVRSLLTKWNVRSLLPQSQAVSGIACTNNGCDKTFSFQSHILSHVKRVHENIRTVPCTDEDCDKMFFARSDMLKHVKSVHDHVRNIHGIKDVPCSLLSF